IKVNVGSDHEAAADKIKELHRKAVAGHDFAQLASDTHDLPTLKAKGGDVGELRKGDFAIRQVEDAVWELQPGQVSDIIQTRDAYYLAKVEARTIGGTRPFEEQAVQKQIHQQLWARQFSALHEQVLRRLHDQAVVRNDAEG